MTNSFNRAYEKAMAATTRSKGHAKAKGWRQIGGDVNPAAHGAVLMLDGGDSVEVHEIGPAIDAGGVDFARGHGVFYTKSAYYNKNQFDWNHRDTKHAASFVGSDSQETWNELSDERKAEALLSYGAGDIESSGANTFAEALPGGVTVGKVKWWSDLAAVKRDITRAQREFKEELKE
jgi:hypothetical protein